MVTYYCCGCRAQYPAPPKRCQRCKTKSFAAVDDAAPTAALLDEPGFQVTAPENLDAELRQAFEESERFRLAAINGLAVPAYPPPVLSELADDAPETPRDMPEQD